MLIVQGKEELRFMPAVTAALLHHSATDRGTYCNFISRL